MLSDRPYMRSEYAQPKTSILIWLIVMIVAGFIVQTVFLRWFGAGQGFMSAFAVTIDGLKSGKVWTLLTYTFLHSPANLLHIVGNLLGLYFIGRVLLPLMGDKRFLYFFGIGFWPFAAVALLGKIRSAAAPPRHVAMPTERVFFPAGIAPQEHAAHRHICGLQTAPRIDKGEQFVRAVKFGEAGLVESGVDKAADGPGFVAFGAVNIALGSIDGVVLLFGGAGLCYAAARLAQNRDPWAVDKVGNDNKAVFF